MATKILFLPIGIGLAHVGRSMMVAKKLQEKGIDIIFAGGPEARELIEKENFTCLPICEFDRKTYDRKLKNNNPFIYSRKILEKFISDELDLYAKVKPDLVVFDTRFTAKISSQIAKIPVVSLQNADATAYYNFQLPVYTLFSRYLPKRICDILAKDYSKKFLQRIGPKIFQTIMVIEMMRFSPFLLRLGYKFSKDPYQLFLGDLTLLLDIPEYRPIRPLPENIKMVGPVFWQGTKELPGWSINLPKDKEIIYATAAGTGDIDIFHKTLEYLTDTDFTVIATTGNTLSPSQVKVQVPNLFVTDYLPGDWIMKKARLVIFPGGNCTAYQALSYGVPQVCTPLHLDQEDNAKQLERLATGIAVNPYLHFTRDTLLTAVGRIIVDKKYKENAIRMQKIIAKYQGAKTAAEEIIKFLVKKEKDPETSSG